MAERTATDRILATQTKLSWTDLKNIKLITKKTDPQ